MSELLEKYRPVFEHIASGSLERELTRTLPHEQLRWLAEAGFGAVRVPVGHGGDGASPSQLIALLVELAAADPHAAQALRGHFAFVEDRLGAAQSEGRDLWLARFARGELVGNAVTEIGSVALGSTGTTVTPTDTGWALTGRKFYTTGSIFADWIDASAVTPDGIEVAALVSRHQPGVVISDDWDGFGQRLTGSGTAVFDNAHVEHTDVYDFGSRFPAQTAFYQLVLVAVLAGITRSVERDVVAELRDRARAYSHGSADESKHDPQLLEAVGRISAAADATASITRQAALTLDAVESEPARPTRKREAELASASAQVVVSELAIRAASSLFDVLGASATSTTRALDRHWRNARTVASHNPVAFKARILGDAAVNGTEPPYEWYVGRSSGR
jgi:alkylation response protein AidB-like acyl-CoA dehydrogenase